MHRGLAKARMHYNLLSLMDKPNPDCHVLISLMNTNFSSSNDEKARFAKREKLFKRA